MPPVNPTLLIHSLSHPDPRIWHRARVDILSSFPLSALPERFPSPTLPHPHTPTLPHPHTPTLPAWLLAPESQPEALYRLAAQAADALHSCPPDTLPDLLHRFAMLPGIHRPLAHALSSARAPELRHAFLRAVTDLQRTQYPLQVVLFPSPACQLHCPYCISAGVEPDAAADMPLPVALRLLDWIAAADIRRVSLTGGEPSLYSHFIPLAEAIRERSFEWFLATNGLLQPNALDAVIRSHPLCVTLHLTPETLASPGLLAHFAATAKALREANIFTALRCNFLDASETPEAWVDVAARTGVPEIRAAVAMPNTGRANNFAGADSLDHYGRLLARLVAAGHLSGIEVQLAKPFPLCCLPETTARYFLANGSAAVNCPVPMRGASNNLIVFPDLSFAPCLALASPRHPDILRYRSPRHAAARFLPDIRRRSVTPLWSRCGVCPLWHGHRCLGGCLSYREAPTR